MSAGDIFLTDADKRIRELEARELGYIQSLRELKATIAELREAAEGRYIRVSASPEQVKAELERAMHDPKPSRVLPYIDYGPNEV